MDETGDLRTALVALACGQADRDPAEISFGAYVNVVCDDDVARARDIGRAGTSLYARFSVMHGTVSGPASPEQREVLQEVRRTYDRGELERAWLGHGAVAYVLGA